MTDLLKRSVSVLLLAVLLNLAFSTFSPQITQFLPFYYSTPTNLNTTMSSNLVLYGHPMSTCTARVTVILKEKGVPFELKTVDLFTGAHKGADYMKMQPFGQVPVLVVRDSFVPLRSLNIIISTRTATLRFSRAAPSAVTLP